MCGFGNGKCRGQLIQERKPLWMLSVCQLTVCQLTDVRGACEAGRGSRWRALCWKCEDESGDDSGRRRMLMRGRCSRSSRLVADALLTAIRRVPCHSHARGLSEVWLPESCQCWVPNAGWTAQQSCCLRSLTGWSSLLQRVCFVLVLNSVTSTQQWIR